MLFFLPYTGYSHTTVKELIENVNKTASYEKDNAITIKRNKKNKNRNLGKVKWNCTKKDIYKENEEDIRQKRQ